MTEDEMLQRFRTAVERAGGCRGFARQVGLHHSVVAEALHGSSVGPKILAALGLERVVTYRYKEGCPG